ncbi:MAG: NTP transferase domain-containing protein [Planctomycetota bacterium]|nr:NTP transferase domain-containing protein [Planctomycetota bacterium]MDI6787356.1 NTP transferase domain-containing protein [Planctomycetota bacterium]
MSNHKVAAVVLAAGKGTRMFSPYPKVLQEICGKPLLYYTFKTLKEIELEKVYVVIGYEAEKVKDAFKDEQVSWVRQNELKGTADALETTAQFLKDHKGSILVLSGDTPLINPTLLKGLIQVHQNSLKTAATVLTCSLDVAGSYGRIIRDKKGGLKGIVEAEECSEKQKKIKEINSGTYVFDNKVFDALKKVKPNPSNGEYYLPKVIDVFAREGKKVKTLVAENPAECLGVNTTDELNTAAKIMRQRIIDGFQQKGVIITDPENTYIEEEVLIGKETIIYPFTVIHSGVLIGERCQVGPFSHLRKGTVLEDGAGVGNFTETKKTRLGRNSKAKHLSYLGDAIIGADVNIGAGTITANYDGVRKEQTVIEDGASTGSGTVLVAPVRMGRRSKTGAGAVVTKGYNVPEDATVVGIPAKPVSNRRI